MFRRNSLMAKPTRLSPGIGRGSPLPGVLSLPLAISVLPSEKLLELRHLLRVENLLNLFLRSLTNRSISPVGLLVELIETLTTFPQDPIEFSLLGLIQTQHLGESIHGSARALPGRLRAFRTSSGTRETRLHQKKGENASQHNTAGKDEQHQKCCLNTIGQGMDSSSGGSPRKSTT